MSSDRSNLLLKFSFGTSDHARSSTSLSVVVNRSVSIIESFIIFLYSSLVLSLWRVTSKLLLSVAIGVFISCATSAMNCRSLLKATSRRSSNSLKDLPSSPISSSFFEGEIRLSRFLLDIWCI